MNPTVQAVRKISGIFSHVLMGRGESFRFSEGQASESHSLPQFRS